MSDESVWLRAAAFAPGGVALHRRFRGESPASGSLPGPNSLALGPTPDSSDKASSRVHISQAAVFLIGCGAGKNQQKIAGGGSLRLSSRDRKVAATFPGVARAAVGNVPGGSRRRLGANARAQAYQARESLLSGRPGLTMPPGSAWAKPRSAGAKPGPLGPRKERAKAWRKSPSAATTTASGTSTS